MLQEYVRYVREMDRLLKGTQILTYNQWCNWKAQCERVETEFREFKANATDK